MSQPAEFEYHPGGRRSTDRDRIYERVAVLEHVADQSRYELRSARDRVAALEAERTGVVTATRELAKDLERLRAEIEQIAASAVKSALEQRDESLREELTARRQGLSLRMQAVAVAFGAAGTTAAIVSQVVR